MAGIVYMLQFDTPLGNDNHRANIYIGMLALAIQNKLAI